MSRTPINYESFIHPNDQRALAALKAIPLLDKVYKIIMEWGYEKFMYNMNLASLVKIGPNQMPKIYGMLQEVCDKLGIEEPELYLESGPANAYTFGETQRQIVLYSGAVAILSDDELKAVIAHECGHILCHHSLYGSMTRTLMQVGVNMIPLPNVMLLSLYYALLYWNRCSEYSADRVAAYVMGDADVVGKQLMKLTGGFVWNSGELNYNEFLRQADKVEDLEEQSLINKGINFWLEKDLNHPFPALRAKEVKEWFDRCSLDLPSPANEAEGNKNLKWE
ncbi:MAG: M48 family metallopeptidase [Lentisphaeria bacterium]|nr:M48 family metallopeptidase [Lentisphaeria bacterium]